MKSFKLSNNIHTKVFKELLEKLSSKGGRVYHSSLYAGLTVANFLSKLDIDEDDVVIIKVNKELYNPILHDMKTIKRYRLKHEMVRKEFKEKIILHIENLDDLLDISPDVREYKSIYGYIVKVVLHITTG